MWKTLVWVLDVISDECIVLKGDIQDIIHSFLNTLDSDCHPLFRDAQLLRSSFIHVIVQYIWSEENMCADFIANKVFMA